LAQHHTLWAVARPHIGMRSHPSEALPECGLRDVRGISLRRVASPRGGVCDFELMDRSWSARDEEPTLWHTYLEPQCPQVCAPERAVLGCTFKLFLCGVGGLCVMSQVLCGVKGGSI
jgi:hypothetical protein